MREALVRKALRPFKPRARTVREATAITDFYVWKAFSQQGVTTRRAVEVVYRSLLALADPDAVGEKGSGTMTPDMAARALRGRLGTAEETQPASIARQGREPAVQRSKPIAASEPTSS
jgi:hypothetical protein